MRQIRLTSSEQSIIDHMDDSQTDKIETVERWSSQNSGSHNRTGLDRMRNLLFDRFASLPGNISDIGLPKGEHVTLSGGVEEIEYAPALKVTVRPEAPIQLVLTGHYDTVFPRDFHFQTPVRVDEDLSLIHI